MISRRRTWILGCFFVAIFFAKTVFCAEEKTPLIILALGDSTTAGTPGFRSPVETPPRGEGNLQSQYAYWIMRKHPEWKVLNRGVNGERTDQIFERFKHDAEFFHPRVVIILAGVNDLFQGQSARAVESKLQKIYEFAIEKNMRVVVCTILPYDRATPEVRQNMAALNRWIIYFAETHGFLFCDTHSVVSDSQNPEHLAGSPDGLHPGVEGYKKMGEALAAVLEK